MVSRRQTARRRTSPQLTNGGWGAGSANVSPSTFAAGRVGHDTFLSFASIFPRCGQCFQMYLVAVLTFRWGVSLSALAESPGGVQSFQFIRRNYTFARAGPTADERDMTHVHAGCGPRPARRGARGGVSLLYFMFFTRILSVYFYIASPRAATRTDSSAAPCASQCRTAGRQARTHTLSLPLASRANPHPGPQAQVLLLARLTPRARLPAHADNTRLSAPAGPAHVKGPGRAAAPAA